MRDWTFSRERFEDAWRGRPAARYPDARVLVQRFAAVTAPILAVSGTVLMATPSTRGAPIAG